jgi:hypothetical protein
MGQLKAVFADPGKYFAGAAQSLGNAIGNAVRGAFDWAKNQMSGFGTWIQEQKNNYARSRAQGRTAAIAQAFGSPGVKFGNLGQAVNYEMANKPPGSDLVIANSSETIIPAAKGWGGKMMSGGVNVRSIPFSSGGSMGGTSVGNIHVTVNAGHTNDPDKLATIVAQRLSQAIQEVRSASVYVA